MPSFGGQGKVFIFTSVNNLCTLPVCAKGLFQLTRITLWIVFSAFSWKLMTCLFSLKEEFPAWYEKLVLEMVHHNTASLEKLVDTAWLEIMTKYAVGEECDFEVSACFYLFF